MNEHEKINYIEFPANDMVATKQFFGQAFDWTFEEFGPDYVAFHNAGIEGGFFRSEQRATTANGSALIVFYSRNLEETLEKVRLAGGEIVKPVFGFPGGRRFHFADPCGNEFAVWSEVDAAGATIT